MSVSVNVSTVSMRWVRTSIQFLAPDESLHCFLFVLNAHSKRHSVDRSRVGINEVLLEVMAI